MTTRKRNDWLEADQSEDDDQGYDSENLDSRGTALGARDQKRRKVDIGSESDSDADGVSARPTRDGLIIKKKNRDQDQGQDQSQDEEEVAENEIAEIPQIQKSHRASDDDPTKILKALTPKQLAKAQKAAKRTGVIYLSRVPPFMKPQTVRNLLEPYGEIGRIFLTPEDPAAHTRRVKAGGNKKRSFVDGWIEFVNKKNAKIVAETLNTHIIGGKKGGWYHDDVWNIKYLKGFKWHHLTDQIANENAERAARLRTEIAHTTRENKVFLQNVERAKMLEGMQARYEATGKSGKGNAIVTEESPEKEAGRRKDYTQHFRQTEVRTKSARKKGDNDQQEDVKRVLSKIF
ncbi:hypothetical protein K402DRAFT_397787 [Aulographum hederae CBS 113979]|uniref:18S rRNA factor 2 n=1 Tax=Aulographum hederae CBS 113979 TaxID=1176131 RepID=A0A6G1GMK8_9PEZI|nr:hypothetical protein K402DRAFT_397787 [Aulographum hederae CBS 113979]